MSLPKSRILALESAVYRLAALAEHYGVADPDGYREEAAVLLRAEWLAQERRLRAAKRSEQRYRAAAHKAGVRIVRGEMKLPGGE